MKSGFLNTIVAVLAVLFAVSCNRNDGLLTDDSLTVS